MESLKDLLKSANPEEPTQISALKNYVMEKHGKKSQVKVASTSYNLTVDSASLASRLHMETPKIIEKCKLDKKLFIRIGHID